MNSLLKGFKNRSLVNGILKYTMPRYNCFYTFNSKYYHPVRELMKKKSVRYYSDPVVVGEELIRIICLHDKVKDPSQVTLSSTFQEIGLDSLDFVECILQIENHLGYDFGSADWEQFITINDIAQFLAKDFFAEKH